MKLLKSIKEFNAVNFVSQYGHIISTLLALLSFVTLRALQSNHLEDNLLLGIPIGGWLYITYITNLFILVGCLSNKIYNRVSLVLKTRK